MGYARCNEGYYRRKPVEARMQLNKEQKEAAETLEGPVLVIAGPGTGKTQLLSARAANIMAREKIAGENILILTYTNAAAKSVKERLAKIIGFEGYEILTETFHSFANSIILDSEEASEVLRRRIQITDLEKAKCFEYIVDSFPDRIKALRPFGFPYFYVPDIRKRISELKNEGITPEKFEKSTGTGEHLPKLEELSFIYGKYEELKKGGESGIFDERGRYDYDDMIMLAIEVLTREPELKKAYREKYKYVMVDEFQDTNGAQLALLLLLCDERHPNLFCVGDDDQSIYRFQGASIANFKTLKTAFPKIKIIKLKNNYRSTKEIVDLSSDIIKQVPGSERLDEHKKLFPQKVYKNKRIEYVIFTTEEEEINYIVQKIKELKKPYSETAVLVRKRAYIPKLTSAFLEKGIPYATDGKEDITGEKRVRQMLEALTLAELTLRDSEDKDIALFRVLSCDFFGIPAREILKFIAFANAKRKKTSSTLFTEFLSAFKMDDTGKRPDKTNKMRFASWVIHRLFRDSAARPLHDILMGFIEDSGLYKFLIEKYGKNRIVITRELRALASFISMAKDLSLSRPDLSLSSFLDELETMKTHNIPISGHLVSATQDGVRVITAHASKGLEYDTCFIPFCIQDKSWPLKPYPERLPLPPEILKRQSASPDKAGRGRLSFFDETRLFYVASSRAKSNLFFTSSPSEKNVTSSFFNNLKAPLQKSELKEEVMLKEFFEKSGDSLELENTEDILRDLVKNLILTPTKLNKFLRCRRQFFYDSLLLLPGRKNASIVFGNCAHKGLEDTYLAYKKEGGFPDFDFFKKIFLTELKFQGVNKKIENSCRVKLESLKGWFEKTRQNPVVPINLEKKKRITLKNGIIFTGKYDKVEFEDEKNGLVRIVDYKTGKPDKHIKAIDGTKSLASEKCDDYFRQLVAYKMLYERDTYEPAKFKVSSGVLAFLEPVADESRKYGLKKGSFVDKKVAVTDKMVDELEGVIQRAWKDLSGLRFEKLPKRDYKKCRTCAFDAMCWG